MMGGVAVVFCVGVLDSLEGVCALTLLLPETTFARVAVGEVEGLLLAVESFHEYSELLALGGDEVEFFGRGSVG